MYFIILTTNHSLTPFLMYSLFLWSVKLITVKCVCVWNAKLAPVIVYTWLHTTIALIIKPYKLPKAKILLFVTSHTVQPTSNTQQVYFLYIFSVFFLNFFTIMQITGSLFVMTFYHTFKTEFFMQMWVFRS